MVASEQEKVLRILDFVGQQQADRLQRLLSSIDIISKEEVVGLWREAAVLEQTQQVVVLAVNITCRKEN